MKGYVNISEVIIFNIHLGESLSVKQRFWGLATLFGGYWVVVLVLGDENENGILKS